MTIESTDHVRTPRVAMSNTRLRNRMVNLRKEMTDHDRELGRLRARMHQLVQEAVEAGEPVTAVAAASGYHRQRVFQLTTERGHDAPVTAPG